MFLERRKKAPHLCLSGVGHRLDGTRPLVQFLRAVLFGQCCQAQNTGDTPHGEAGRRQTVGETPRTNGKLLEPKILTVLFEKGWLLAQKNMD